MSERRGVFRTVRNGEVTIGGVRYRPRQHHMPYDGRLDGQRFLFGRYLKPGHPGEWEPFVSLWGTERAARDKEVNPHDGPHVVDGKLPWDFWEAVP